MDISKSRITGFRKKIWRFYASHKRQFPFRETTDPYQIAVSEFMLQQTQAERVVYKYLTWIDFWPNWYALANADKKELLSRWSGLGYNRRAVYLGNLAKIVVNEYNGQLPQEPDILQTLPGIGPYTARAILIFAFNKNLITIDTNIHRVLLHEFQLPLTTPKTQIEHLALMLMPRGKSREWHNALMDYGNIALSGKPAAIPPVSKQSRFKGSIRQIRGEIIRQLTAKNKINLNGIAKDMNRTGQDVLKAAEGLHKDGLIIVNGNWAILAD